MGHLSQVPESLVDCCHRWTDSWQPREGLGAAQTAPAPSKAQTSSMSHCYSDSCHNRRASHPSKQRSYLGCKVRPSEGTEGPGADMWCATTRPGSGASQLSSCGAMTGSAGKTEVTHLGHQARLPDTGGRLQASGRLVSIPYFPH